MDSLQTKTMKIMANSVFAELPETYNLSPEQIHFYRDHGYLVIKELIDFGTLYSCKQRFVQICKGLVDKGQMTVMKELSLIGSGAIGEDLINKVQDILHDDVFSSYTEHPRLLHVLSQLIGSDITGMHSMLINKPPGTGRHPPHQDLYYFPFRPAAKIVAAWTAIDHVRLDNGCLYVIPGSHKPDRLYEHGYPPAVEGVINKMYHGIQAEEQFAPEDSRVPLEMSPGDTVLFHPLLVHGSGPNVSKGYRKALSCHYAASDCHYIDVTGTNQEIIAREVEEIGARRGYRLEYKDIWKYRSKLVKGVKCNL